MRQVRLLTLRLRRSMFSYPLGLRGKLYIAATLGFLWMALTAYNFTETSNVCCDAVGYGLMASSYSANGFVYPHQFVNVRSYLFPFLLYLSHAVTGELPLVLTGKSYVTFSLNTFLFLGAVFTMNRKVSRLSQTAAWLVTAGLILNPLLIVYLPWQLTDSSSTSLCILVCACAVGLSSLKSSEAKAAFLLGSLFASAAYEIRPANIALVVAWVATQCVYLSGGRISSGIEKFKLAFLSLVLLVIPTIPQVVVNYTLFDQVKAGPIYDVGNLQLEFGVKYLKYATSVATGEGASVPYVNSFLGPNAIGATSVLDLFSKSFSATVATLLLHIFSGLNYDYFEPYIQNIDSYRWQPFQIFSQAINISGFFFLCYFFRSTGRDILERKRLAPLKFFVVSLTALTLLLLSVIAVETRFGLNVTALFGVLALFSIHKWFKEKDQVFVILLPLVVVAWIVISRLLSNYLVPS